MFEFDLQLFSFTPGTDPGTETINPINVTTQTTTGADMSPTMKTFFNRTLLLNAREKSVFSQFAEEAPFTGNTIEWRKFNTFELALTPLTEGVIPSGQMFGLTSITASTTQHGTYVPISDRLEAEAFDDVMYNASEEMGASAGETDDILTRNILLGGNSVAYAPKVSGSSKVTVSSRAELDATAILDPDVVLKTVTWLKKNKAPTFEGNTYVMIIHPSQSEDLRNSEKWIEFHKYNDTTPIFKGEIGQLHGMRFIESNNVKVYKGADLTAGARNLTVKTAISSATTTVAVKEVITSDDAAALAGRTILLGTLKAVVASASAAAAGSATLTLTASVDDVAANTVVYPGEGGAAGCATYAAFAMGKKAYGKLKPSGESMQMIHHTKEEIGGPLDQFGTIGYKFCHGAVILYQERFIRVETGSSYSSIDEAN